ncbi:cell division protein ZapA [Candidatus Sulfidibacterium hydrothermale]|uniref:cell division protein ZapA n=1 Tax=Candidatus Sulfidibacterium hydrothermale TaxID=2875962 RepID=UPI001F0A966A|nr:cell division protein ZapA [Candidatus Sulfidibacterium hydrothermale]UBM61224.1 cell division protein ZapA [Candidatus Sulfidibacterium hydrothermale]
MQDAFLNIKVVIAGRPYKMRVRREQEEIVRKAAESVEEEIRSFAHTYEHQDQQDILAMIALQNAVGILELEQKKDFREKEMMTKLQEIDEVLSHQLSAE